MTGTVNTHPAELQSASVLKPEELRLPSMTVLYIKHRVDLCSQASRQEKACVIKKAFLKPKDPLALGHSPVAVAIETLPMSHVFQR